VITAALYTSETISDVIGYSVFGKAQVGDNLGGPSSEPELIVGTPSDSVAFHTCWDSTPESFDTGPRLVKLTASPGGSNGVTWALQGNPPASQTYTGASYGALGQVELRSGMTVPGFVQWSSIMIQWSRNGVVVDSFSRLNGPTVDGRGSTGPMEREQVLVVSTSVSDADKVVIWGKVEIEYEQGIYPAPDDLFAEVFLFPSA
jgi:hypothetical protein